MRVAAEPLPRQGFSKQRSSGLTSLQLKKSRSPNTLSSVMRFGITFTSLSVTQNAAKQMLPACKSTTRLRLSSVSAIKCGFEL